MLHEAFLSHWDEALEDVEGSRESSKFSMVFLGLTRLLMSSIQADRLKSQMRSLLEIQEGVDLHLEQRDKELRQPRSQSQAKGAQLAALSLQLQELISSVESRAEVVGKDLEEINGRFDRHSREINRLKIREKDAKEETEKLKGFIVGAGHEAQVFKDRLDRMEENVCRCGRTPSEVREEFVSSEDKGRMELSYASVREDEYVAPPVENSFPIPIPAPASSCCLGSVAAPLPPLGEITEEATFICDNLDSLLREADEERARELQEGPSNLVVRSPPRVGSQQWRRLNGIHCMRPGPGRRDQRATRSRPYLQRDSTRCPRELWGPCEDLFLISSNTHSFSSVPPPPDLNKSLNCSLCKPSTYAHPHHEGYVVLVYRQHTPKGLRTTSCNS